MRIGFYGMPTAGKTYILDKIDFIEVVAGSKCLKAMCPDFESKDEIEKNKYRRMLAESLVHKESFIADGHYAFGDKMAFTSSDGDLYDVFLYLYISPRVLKERMYSSARNRKFLSYDVDSWQNNEIDCLRAYCHRNNKDFYVIDNPPNNTFDDVGDVIEFIRDIINGYSCVAFARNCAEDILKRSRTDTVILMDGDKTITKQDTSNVAFGYTTHLYDGNFYTGYQSWRQGKEFMDYAVEEVNSIPVELNEQICNQISENTFILTSGHEKIWSFIAQKLNVPFYCGQEMAAETKYFITKILQEAGKRVIAYGDGMNDYFMLKKADTGYLVRKKDGSISRSLKTKNLEGICFV